MTEPSPGHPDRCAPRRRFLACCLIGALALSVPAAWAEDGTTRLQRIQARGTVNCGLARAQPGFSRFGATGEAQGFDADFCRALAAAVFGDLARARFTPVATAREFTGRADLDVAFHRLTVNFTRSVTSGLDFAPVTFHDGQAFLVRDGFGDGTIAGLPRATICVEAETRMAANLKRFLAESGLDHGLRPIAGSGNAARAFFQGGCTVLSEDASSLFALASDRLAGTFHILADRISKEPLAPVVRRTDQALKTVLTWVIHAVIHAEEVGVSSRNVMEDTIRRDPRRGGFLDLPAALVLGLRPDWARAVIRQVGNYGEIYARHFAAPGGPRLGRGRNRLARNGGLLYAPPLE